MSFHHLGETRSRRSHNHLLQTPDAFVWAPLPGMEDATACVHCAPVLGARFAMYTVVLQQGGTLGQAIGSRFIYVLEGSMRLHLNGREQILAPGGYAFLPEGCSHVLRTIEISAKAVVVEKLYASLPEISRPDPLVGVEGDIADVPLLGDPALLVRSLLPDAVSFDFAVNTMQYQPGASLSMVESHVMEHGLLMLEGEGIYRLDDAWYPVAKGDFIWMAAFCPQWFAALGKTPAKYLIYKDWNRHPLGTMRR